MGSNEDALRGEIVGVLRSNMGAVTADLYDNFYKDKDIDIIIGSATELLVEFLGEAHGKSIATDLKNKYLK
jgi:hypothetical protein